MERFIIYIYIYRELSVGCVNMLWFSWLVDDEDGDTCRAVRLLRES